MRETIMDIHIILIFIISLHLPSDFAEYTWGSPVPPSLGRSHKEEQPPVFDTSGSNSNVVSVLVGQTAYLPCRVKHRGDKVVSWIRHRDLHILTSGPHTYTSDSRVEVVHPDNSDLWTLRIHSARRSDRGRYECQVNTEPKLMRAVHLDVTAEADMTKDSPYTAPKLQSQSDRTAAETGETEVRISGPAEQFVQLGNTVTFTCVARGPASSTGNGLVMTWLHGARPVSARQPHRAVSVDTERGPAGANSRLTLPHITPADSGNYTCIAATTAPEARAASVSLVVVDGEHTEAMQRDMSTNAAPKCTVPQAFAMYAAILLSCAVSRQN